MQWTDSAIILASQKYSEQSAVVSLLTPNHGFYKGYVSYFHSKKNRGVYQAGNLVEVTWKGRLAEQLGSFSADLTSPIAALLLTNSKKLLALSSICSLLEKTLAEREPCIEIYQATQKFLAKLISDNNWEAEYIHLELNLLAQLGFGLDLTKCIATGEIEDLIYVSPKSGCAVSKNAGEPYKERLLKLPMFLANDNYQTINLSDIKNGLALSSYFFNKYIFHNEQLQMPKARVRWMEMVDNS